MWISLAIAATKIGSIWAREIVVRRIFQTGTTIFIAWSVIEARKIKKNEFNQWPGDRNGQTPKVDENPSEFDDDFPF